MKQNVHAMPRVTIEVTPTLVTAWMDARDMIARANQTNPSGYHRFAASVVIETDATGEVTEAMRRLMACMRSTYMAIEFDHHDGNQDIAYVTVPGQTVAQLSREP